MEVIYNKNNSEHVDDTSDQWNILINVISPALSHE